MRTHLSTFLRTAVAPLALAAVAPLAGCGSEFPEVIVAGKTLIVMEQNYGLTATTERYCDAVTNQGQFQVMLTSKGVCDDIKAKKENRAVFHGGEITVLRLIFPGGTGSIKVTGDNVFQVGRGKCVGGSSVEGGGVAVAQFSHNPEGADKYDVDLQAESGTITIPGDGYDKGASQLRGRYDLVINGEAVSGTFDTTYCKGLTDYYAQRYGQ